MEGPLHLCLREWREQHQLDHHLTLSNCPGFTSNEFNMQIIDFKTDGSGKPTGEVTLTDGELIVGAMLGAKGAARARFVELLKLHKFGMYSIVCVCKTVGPPEDLTIVSGFVNKKLCCIYPPR